MAYDLKPFVINLNDLLYLLQQVNFVPLFDGPANSNGIVNFDAATMDAWDAKGNQVWDHLTGTGSYQGTALNLGNVALLGTGFPHVSSPIGIRDVSGLHNNLFGDQALWGAVDVPFRRDIPADFSKYVTSPGADYGAGNNVIDLMPRIISRTITTGGINLLKDSNGHFVEWDSALYASATPDGLAYKALVDASGVDTAQLVEGAKIIAPATTEVAVLDGNGAPLVWHMSDYLASAVYTATLGAYSNVSFGGLYGSATGGPLTDGGPIFYQPVIGTFQQIVGQTYQPALLAYKQIIDGAGVVFTDLVEGNEIVATLATSGYGLLEQLGHIDFQNPASGEFFIGSENPGVAPVNSWFGIFGQFFDHGLDLIGKGGNGTITIQLETTDPLYRAPGSNGPGDPGYTAITVNRATIAGTDANGDPNYVNHTSPFIDQSQTYGSVDQITQLLRKWVSTDGGATYHAGIELFDGQSLQDTWTRRWPDGTTSEVNDTLPTLNELRQHVIETGRDALTWEDVLNYRNRDASGTLSGGDSGHALILDMNPHFDGATGPGTGHITQASLDKLSIALGGSAGDIPAATFNVGMIMPYLNPDFTINTGDAALHEAISDILMDSVGDHYIAGDGRVNENMGLTSIHHVFHEEHNYQVENLKTWIYAHDANNPGALDSHEQLHNWQTATAFQDSFGNYMYNNTDVTVVGPGVFKADASNIAWDADKMFEATKLIVEMEYQHAAVDQYARTVTPRIQEFVGYSTGVDSTISLEYAQVAFRFGHSTIRETIDAIDPSGWMLGNVTRYALEKAFLAPQTFAQEGIAAITLGLSRQQMNEVDEFVTPALSQGLLDLPLDLPAINIARGRDLGIPTLNDFREGISLARYTSWDDFGKNMIHPESLVNFIAAYSFDGDVSKAAAIMGLFDGTIVEGDTEALGYTAADALAFMLNNTAANAELDTARDGFDHIDSWIGGLAEAHVPGGLLGETFDAVFVAQIQSLMDGDRFYYLYRLFGTQLHEEVNNGQFKDIVERNTGLSHLNGSIFAYADKYYDFNRAADGTLDGVGDDLANHLYHDTLAAHPALGIFSDGGASTDPNGSIISVTGSDFVRPDVTNSYIRDVRPELDPTQVHTVEGTPTSGADSHEVIVGTDNADFIHARSGDDTVYGEGGDDFIYGDGGVDRLYGGAGNDLIDTGEGPDLADGGAGKDVIYGRGSGSEVGGFDQLVGGSGNDLIIGGEGIDKLSGGSGDDIIYGDGLTNPEMGNTDPFTHGGDGNDYIDGGASGDLLFGEEGDDYLVGGNDQDLMQGGQGDDIIRPGNPSQASGTTGGPDEVLGDDGQANLGFDLIDFSDYTGNAPGVTVDFATQNNPLVNIDQTTTFPAWFQIEGAIGSQNNDTFIGDSDGDATADNSHGNNWLIGGSGDDVFTGNGGNDIIVGGSIRLDALIGQYAGADNGNLVLGSIAWLGDAMATTAGGSGYGDNTEDAYTGASNRALGDIGNNGLIDAANLAGGAFDKHFTEMLRSRMFKDLVLGDNGTDGAQDMVMFSGNFAEYSVVQVTGPGGLQAQMIIDSVAGRDGIDLVTGVDLFKFGNATAITTAELLTGLNQAPVFASPTATLSVPENSTGSVGNASATDPNGNTLIYTLSGADAALFDINSATGALSFKTSPNFEAPQDAGPNNVYDVIVTATDPFAASAQQAIAISVTNVDDAATGALHMHNLFSSTATTVTLNSDASLFADPDLPGGVTFAYQWTRVAGNATPTSASSSSITISAGTQVSTFTLTGTYNDGFGSKTINAVETAIIGTVGGNTLNGTAGDNLLAGFNGNDVLQGNGGNDVLDGGNGNDSLNGGTGADIVRGAAGNDTITDTDGMSGDIYSGGIGSDGVIYATGSTFDFSAAGADIIDSTIEYVSFMNASTVTGTAGVNRFSGHTSASNADTFYGMGGNDWLTGFTGWDTLDGGADNDRIDGGAGNDWIRGGAGTDVLTGGNSSTTSGDGATDTFFYAVSDIANSAVDTIYDFETGLDRIGLDGASFGLAAGALGAPRFMTLAAYQGGGANAVSGDVFAYNQSTGRLYWDADGATAGGLTLVAILDNHAALTLADLQVF